MAQLKVYSATESSNSFLPNAAREAVGEASHVRQGAFYVVAYTKVAALEMLKAADLAQGYARVGQIKLAMGDHFQSLSRAGLLTLEGEILIRAVGGKVVGRFEPSTNTWKRIGELRWERRSFEYVADAVVAPEPKQLLRWTTNYLGNEHEGHMGTVALFSITTVVGNRFWPRSITVRPDGVNHMTVMNGGDPTNDLDEAKAVCERAMASFLDSLGVAPKED